MLKASLAQQKLHRSKLGNARRAGGGDRNTLTAVVHPRAPHLKVGTSPGMHRLLDSPGHFAREEAHAGAAGCKASTSTCGQALFRCPPRAGSQAAPSPRIDPMPPSEKATSLQDHGRHRAAILDV
mmetsp:Transcript_4882/g.10095  ORF Transcript_4882/g.10095 Transcript_4882/m.10095 type:complete len:125 (-) Transcript_4882:172-546(-)